MRFPGEDSPEAAALLPRVSPALRAGDKDRCHVRADHLPTTSDRSRCSLDWHKAQRPFVTAAGRRYQSHHTDGWAFDVDANVATSGLIVYSKGTRSGKAQTAQGRGSRPESGTPSRFRATTRASPRGQGHGARAATRRHLLRAGWPRASHGIRVPRPRTGGGRSRRSTALPAPQSGDATTTRRAARTVRRSHRSGRRRCDGLSVPPG